MYTIVKVFIEFVTLLLLSYVLVFLATRHVGILAPWSGIRPVPFAPEAEVLSTGLLGKSPSRKVFMNGSALLAGKLSLGV